MTGYTDLRSGIDTLVAILQEKLGSKLYETNTLYLFCGRKTERIKGLVWKLGGYLLLYKRLDQGNFQWPRSESEVKALMMQQFRWFLLCFKYFKCAVLYF